MKKEEEAKYLNFANIPASFSNPVFEDIFKRSINDKVNYWREEALEAIDWFKPPATILDDRDPSAPRWYPDGEMNVCYNCLDRHVKNGKGEWPALHAVSVYTGQELTYSYT